MQASCMSESEVLTKLFSGKSIRLCRLPRKLGDSAKTEPSSRITWTLNHVQYLKIDGGKQLDFTDYEQLIV